MTFEIASTNLVLELGIILAISLGWRFTLAEFIAGPLMILFVALGFRLWLRRRIVEAATEQAERGVPGPWRGTPAWTCRCSATGRSCARLLSRDGIVSTSRYFVMDWAAVLRDIVIGLLIAGAFDAWVPREWLRGVFLTGRPVRGVPARAR